MTTYMIYDNEKQEYSKKLTNLDFILFSNRKPDEEKLVGRVPVELSDVLNNKSYQEA